MAEQLVFATGECGHRRDDCRQLMVHHPDGILFRCRRVLLGVWMLGLGVFVLKCMQRIEARWKQQRDATLMVLVGPKGPSHNELEPSLKQMAIRSIVRGEIFGHRKRMALRYTGKRSRRMSSYRHLKRLAERSGVREVRWSSQLETAVTPVVRHEPAW